VKRANQRGYRWKTDMTEVGSRGLLVTVITYCCPADQAEPVVEPHADFRAVLASQ
jgi:hypothetical protein